MGAIPAKRRVIIGLFTLGAFAAFGFRLLGYVEDFSQFVRRDDFNHYYGAAWLLVEQGNLYGVRFADTALASHFDWNPKIPSATNPPFLVLVSIPLAWAEPFFSWLWFELLLFCCLVTTYVLSFRLLWPAHFWSLPILIGYIFFTSTASFFAVLELSQIQGVLLAAILIGWWCVRRGLVKSAAFFWALTVAVKFYTWPLLILFLVWRKYAAALVGFFTAISFLALPALLFGFEIYQKFVSDALPIITSHVDSMVRNYSLSALIFQFVRVSSGGEPAVEWLDPAINLLLPTVVLLGLLSFVYLSRPFRELGSNGGRSVNPELIDWPVAIFLPLSFLLSPVAWDHYLLSTFPALLLAFRENIASTQRLIVLFFAWAVLFQFPHASSTFSLFSQGVHDALFRPLSWLAIGTIFLHALRSPADESR